MPIVVAARGSYTDWAKLLVVAVGTLLFSGCGLFEGKSEHQQMLDERDQFAELVGTYGGSAVFEKRSMDDLAGVGWFIDLSGAEIDDALLNAMAEVVKKKPIFELNLADTSLTDEQLTQLDKADVLQKVIFLNLSNSQITDAGLDGINNFYVIHELNLKGTSVSKEAIKRLGDKQLAQKYTPKDLRKRPNVEI